ncbi:MAG TPA: anhydro-N-acetylmuramic acid kinase [Burkholderiaceae bacterium]
MTALFMGLMSGTSLDGVDGVLADFSAGRPRVLGHVATPLGTALRAELLALNSPGDNELHRAALAANALATVYADTVAMLLAHTGMAASAVRAVGAHGQTVRHRPGEFDGTGYTLQMQNPALLAEKTGITVVADFRSRDVAAGGQGAPLAPGFHQALFGQPGEALVALNLGGISNLSLLHANGSVQGFDCGPANGLMDHWCHQHTGQPFDAGGAWAASGQVDAPLLQALLQEPYFALPPPKSTGRDLFNPAWLARAMQQQAHPPRPEDVQATLAELTVQTVRADLQRHDTTGARELVVCGGGALNDHLMQRLQQALPRLRVASSAARGIPPQQVEATGFAWLARQTVLGQPGNLPKATGAQGARVLGAIYPA